MAGRARHREPHQPAGGRPAARLAGRGGRTSEPPTPRLTNLAHLDFLTSTVVPPAQQDHTTYRLAQEPGVGVLWVYADHQADGSFRRVGGGDYDAATNTYGQGAFDADDISRAAVAYLTAWKQLGDDEARRARLPAAARADLHAGRLRTARRERGALDAARRHPEPQRDARRRPRPRPTPARPSGWVAPSGPWAPGTPRSRRPTPRSPAFLRDRLVLALGAVERQDLSDVRDSGRSSTACAGPRGSSRTAPTSPPRPCTAWSPTTAPAVTRGPDGT